MRRLILGFAGVFSSLCLCAQCSALVLSAQGDFDLKKVVVNPSTFNADSALKLASAFSNIQNENGYSFFPGKPSNYYTLDSVLVDDKAVKYLVSIYDDHFIGGRENYVSTTVQVENIGQIYFSSNFLNGTEAMLWIDDTHLQRTLLAVYLRLGAKFDLSPYYQYAKIIDRFTYTTAEKELAQLYNELKNALVCESAEYSVSNNKVHGTVVIKNKSNLGVYIPKGTNIAPQAASLVYQDRTEEWDFLQTHYGLQFSPLRDSLHLAPGDTQTIHFEFTDLGWQSGARVGNYRGVQFFTFFNLHWVLISSLNIDSATPYYHYPQRNVPIAEY